MKLSIFIFSISLILVINPVFATDPPPKGFKKAIKKHRKAYKKDFIVNNGPVKKEDLKYLDFMPQIQISEFLQLLSGHPTKNLSTFPLRLLSRKNT